MSDLDHNEISKILGSTIRPAGNARFGMFAALAAQQAKGAHMTDTNAAEKINEAAERLKRIANGELGVAVYFPEHRGSVHANNTLDRAADLARDDRRTLADAYLAQQPTYEQQAAEIAELRAKYDDPDTDCTDFAHPAWWRGNDHAVAVLCKEIAELLDGKPLAGSCSQPWQGIRERLAALRTARADDDTAVDEADCYYVQNVSAGYVGNNPMFWAKGGNGYTSYIDKAERFTAKDALELLQHDTSKWRVWPASLITKCTYRTVESQELKRTDAATVRHLLAALGEVRR